MEHRRDDIIADVIDHDVAAERSHRKLVRIRADAHSRNSSSLATEHVLLIETVILGPQVMHHERSFLSGGAEQVRAVRIRRQHVQAASHFICWIMQVDFGHVVFASAVAAVSVSGRIGACILG